MTRLHVAYPGFLGKEAAALVLDYAIANERRFVPAMVGLDGEVDHETRRSVRLDDLGPMRELLEAAAARRVPEMIADLGLSPFEVSGFEVELAATSHAGYYRRHIDLLTGPRRAGRESDRVISVVYYLHREPRRFTGGQLRMYPMWGAAPGDHEDFTPEHDTAVAFSSWVPHEVLPVVASSTAFCDARFTVNCWILRAMPPGD